MLDEATFSHSDYDCQDPLVHESGGPFGEKHWRWFPPEHYCDYSSLHPDWPDELAIDPEPSLSKAWLFMLAPLTTLITGTELIGLAVARHRRRHPPRPVPSLPSATLWETTASDPELAFRDRVQMCESVQNEAPERAG